MVDTNDSQPGRPDDGEAQRLRQRLEQGQLPRDRLTLAEALGHAASRAALGRDPESGPSTQLDAEEASNPTIEFWGRRLGRWGPQAMLQVAVALARGVSARAGAEGEPAAAVSAGLDLADRFLRKTGQTSRDEVEAAAKRLARAALSLPEQSLPRRACQTLLPLLRAIMDVLSGTALNREVLDAHYLRVLEQADATGFDPAELKDEARQELVKWAVGHFSEEGAGPE